jgi:hypothetical protein
VPLVVGYRRLQRPETVSVLVEPAGPSVVHVPRVPSAQSRNAAGAGLWTGAGVSHAVLGTGVGMAVPVRLGGTGIGVAVPGRLTVGTGIGLAVPGRLAVGSGIGVAVPGLLDGTGTGVAVERGWDCAVTPGLCACPLPPWPR